MAEFLDTWRSGGDGYGSYTFQSRAAANKAVIAKGYSGQTANIFEVQNSAGTAVFAVGPTGNLTITGSTTITIDEAVTGDLTVSGNATLGDSSGDTLTVGATSTFSAAATFSSTLSASGQVRLSNGTEGAPALAFTNNTDMGLYRNDTDQMTLSTSGIRRMRWRNDAVTTWVNVCPHDSDGAALGTSSLMWSDLFLASGAVVNFNNGDITVTHSANTLAFAGATGTYTFDDEITPAANDGAALGNTSIMWSDLFLADGGVINFNNGDVTMTHASNALTIAGGDVTLQDASPVLTISDDTAAGSVADDDTIAQIIFKANDASGATNFAQIDVQSSDITDGDEGGQMTFKVFAGGTGGTAAQKNLLMLGGEDVANTTACSIVLNQDQVDCDIRAETVNDATFLVIDSATSGMAITTTQTAGVLDVTADSLTSDDLADWSLDGLTSGSGLKIESTSTACDGYKLIELISSGTAAAGSKTRYGTHLTMSGAGTSSTNVGVYSNVTAGTTANYVFQGVGGTVLLQPSGTGSQSVIDIVPSAAIAAGGTWIGIDVDGTALDPLTGSASAIYGMYADFSGVLSADGDDAQTRGTYVLLPTGDTATNYAHVHGLNEMTVAGTQVGFASVGGSLALSYTSTYRGLWVDWDSITRDANSPVLEGLKIELPASYTSFGTSYAGYMSGGGESVTFCDGTYAINTSDPVIVGTLTTGDFTLSDATPVLTFSDTTATGSVADDDAVAQILFNGNDAAGATTYVQVDVLASDITDGDEGGKISWTVMSGGTAGTAAANNLFSIGGEDVANSTQCEVVVNEAGIDCDFRVEYTTADAFYVKGDTGNVVIGTADGATGAHTGNTLRASDHPGGTDTDSAGADLTIAAGKGTGAGDVGQIIMQTPRVGGSGTTAHTVTTLFTLDESTATLAGDLSLSGDITLTGTDSQLVMTSHTTTSGIMANLVSTPASASTGVIMQLEAQDTNWGSGARILNIISDDDDAIPIVINDGSGDKAWWDRSGGIYMSHNLVLQGGGNIQTNSNNDLTLLPNGTGITIVGNAGSTSHSLAANDDLFVSGKLEVDGNTYFDDNVTLANSRSLIMGNSGATLTAATVQTPDTSMFGMSSASRSFLFCDVADAATDFANPQQTHPTVIFQNADANSIYGRGYIAHDNDDFTFQSHRGGFSFEVPAQYAQGTMTLTGIPTADETFVINATTITAKADGSGDVDHFTIGADAAETVTNIVATLAECSESANITAWDGAGDTVVIEWKTAGTAGNAIVFTEAMSNCTVDGGGTLGGTHAGVAASTLLALNEGGTATFTGDINASNAAGPAIIDEAATTTNPTLCPNKAEEDTGIGWASDTIHFIGGGSSLGNINSTALTVGGDVSVGDDLLLASSGSIINWNSGDVTLTHSAGKLTWGGDGTVEIDFNNHEMTNVDINSGAIDGVTIGTGSAVTQLTVDDVDINGKVITMTGSASDLVTFTAGTNGTLVIQTVDDAAAAANLTFTIDGTIDIDSAGALTLDSGAAINLEPAAGSAVLIDGTVSIDGGVVSGVTTLDTTSTVTITPSSAATGLYINQDNNYFSIDIDSENTSASVIRSTTINTSGDAYSFSNTGAQASGVLFFINQDNASSAAPTLQVQNDGTGDDLVIDNNNTGKSINIDHDVNNATAGTRYSLYLDYDRIGNVASGTDTNYGIYVTPTVTGASGGTINTYGVYSLATGDAGGTSTAYGGWFSAVSADTNYGLWVNAGHTVLNANNLGIGVSAWGTNATNTIGITADGTVPGSSPAGMIQIFADDSSGGATNATLALRTEEAVAADGDVAGTHTLNVWINGVEYHLLLAAV